MSSPLLACAGAGFARNGVALLQDVSIQVQPGERLGVVGPNGSGKSTLLKLMAGIATPTTGAVHLGGQPMAGMNRREVARLLALVQQHADTRERIRLWEVVALGRTPWLSALAPWGAEHDRQVALALEAVDLAHLAQRPWHSLSGGERQRGHLARALAQQPRLLLLDEPTNHLDIRQQLSLLGLIHRLPVTTVIALHDLNQALTCDRVAVLDHGRLVALGPPAQVLTPRRLAETFGVRGRWLTDPGQRSVLVLAPLE